MSTTPRAQDLLHQAKSRLTEGLARNRHNPVLSRVDRAAVSLHRAFSNLSYDMGSNGETRVLQALAGAAPKVVFDVGANDGSWSLTATGVLPAEVWAFEIVPRTFAELAAVAAGEPRIHAFEVGMAESEREQEVYCPPSGSGLASCMPGVSEAFHEIEPEVVTARVITGDLFCEREGIEHIDLLKIDVEGYEPNVLEGFTRMLSEQRVDVVQFEYGYANIHSRFLLKDFHELFAGYDMTVGKIYPDTVEFREYRFTDEDFLGPNYLAVARSRPDLITRFAR